MPILGALMTIPVRVVGQLPPDGEPPEPPIDGELFPWWQIVVGGLLIMGALQTKKGKKK